MLASRGGQAALGLVAALLLAEPAWACSACLGDPNSQMVVGARAGVLVLLGVVIVVLAGMVSLIVFWSRRAASLEALRSQAAENEG